jgi:hypothetical protein
LSGTLYFWTHGSEIQARGNIDATKAGSGAYAYTSDDYSTYTLTGGVGLQVQLLVRLFLLNN